MIYQIDGQLRTAVTRALFATRDKMIENIKLNSAEDMWHPMNLKTKQQREKLIDQYARMHASKNFHSDFRVKLSSATNHTEPEVKTLRLIYQVLLH